MNLLLRSHLRQLWRDRMQTLLAVLGIAIGVAVVLAVDLANAASREAMRIASEQLDGSATHAIVGAGERLAEAHYAALRLRWRAGAGELEDVRSMAPIVTAQVRLTRERDGDAWPVQLLGVDPTADAGMRAAVPAPGTSGVGRLMSEPGTALLDRDSLRRLGLDPEALSPDREDGTAEVWLQVDGSWRPLTLLGSFDLAQRPIGQGLLLTDIATAQELLQRQGWLSRIDLQRAQPPPSSRFAVVLERLFPGLVLPPAGAGEQELDAGLRIVSLAEQEADTRALAASFQLNLAALGLLALLVGAFLVHGTLSHAVLRRRRLFGRLRVLGVQAAELRRMVLVEAAVMGLLGVVLGLLLGRWLAGALLELTAGTLEQLYGQVAVAALAPDPVPWLKAAGVGLLATLLAGMPAATRATESPAEQRARPARRHGVRGLALGLLAATAGFVLLPGLNYFGGLLAVGALLLAAALLTPDWVRACLHSAQHLLRSAPLGWRLLLRESERGLTRSGVASAALVMAMATAMGMGLMVDSFRVSVDRWLEARLTAPLQLQLPGEHRELPADLAAVLPAWSDGSILTISWRDRVDRQPVRVSVVEEEGEIPSDLGLAMLAGSHDQQGVVISEPLARRLGIWVGAELALPQPGGAQPVRVSGVFREYGAGPGLILVPAALGFEVLPGRMTVELYGGRAETDAARRALAQLAPEGSRVRHDAELLAMARAIFERTFRVTSVLQAIAAVVAGFGLFAALSALSLERRVQYGVLRTIGVGRWTPVLQNHGEALLLALAALLLAMPLGVGVAIILIEVVNVRAFGWSLDWHFAPPLFLQATLGACLAALLAASLPALSLWRATPRQLLTEVRADA